MSEQTKILFDLAEKIAADAQTCERIAINTNPLDKRAMGKCEGLRLAKQYVIEAALRAQQEQPNPQPLTLEEIKEHIGKPVFDILGYVWRVVDDVEYIDELLSIVHFTDGDEISLEDHPLAIYAHEPKGEHHG